MPAWLSGLLGWLFGGTKQSATDQQLGQAQQQNADLRQTVKDDQRAHEIEATDSRLTHQQLIDSLRPPPDSSRSG